MARSIPALVTPSVLVHARTTAGFDLSTAADRLDVPVTKLEAWERGDAGLTMARLKRLSTLYRRPLSFFYLPAPPVEREQATDFRASGVETEETHVELRLQIRRVQELREVAVRLEAESEMASRTDLPAGSPDGKPAELAGRLRAWLGVELRDQLAWKDSAQAFREWRTRIERRGVLVFQFTSVPVSVARGFSVSAERLPVIAVNSQDPPVARSFTALHELAHLALRQAGVCDFSTRREAQGLERFCNLVAAEVLIPVEALRERLPEGQAVDVAQLAKDFKVSREAMALRLIAAQRLPWSSYEGFRTRHIKEVEETRVRQKEKEREGGPEYTRLVVTNLGQRFLRLVLHAYQDGLVTAPEFKDYTSVRVTGVEKLQAMMGEPA